jgi:uncharacterized membrane protein YgdD (TMEM256/DUF423 family)
MDRKIIATAAFFGLTSVILGAFGAHALKEILSPGQLATFETGVRYQMYHALFLLFLGTNAGISAKTRKTVFYLISGGIILFSGSVYLLATNTVPNINKIIGPITPLGGLLLIIGWFLVFLDFLKKKS